MFKKRKRIKLFKKAIIAIENLIEEYPEVSQFDSVKKQLNYLLELEENKRDDYDKLKEIIIGIITVREIEDRDMEIADLMYDVTEEVDKMKKKNKIR